METSLTGDDSSQLYQRAIKLIDCHVNIAVTWSKHDFPSCEIYHSECHCGCERHRGSQIRQAMSPGDNL